MSCYDFTGVKRHDGQYYYDHGDIPTILIPLDDSTEGNFPLSKGELQEWFGISDTTLPRLPKFLIKPRLSVTFGGTTWKYGVFPTDRFNVSGSMVVYKPVAWVAHITELSRIPKTQVETEISKETTTTTRKEIYGNVGSIFQVSAAPNYMGMKVEATIKADARAEFGKKQNKR